MSSKRLNGSGTVYQRKDGRWVAAVTLAGKRIERYGRTRREAQDRLDDLVMERRLGRLASPTKLTVEQWTVEYLEMVEPDLRPTTVATYRQILGIIASEIGDVRLDALTPLVLSQAFVRLQRAGRGRRRLQLAHTCFKACLKRAVDLGIIGLNPMERVPKLRGEPQERIYWNLDETKRFIKTALATDSMYGSLLVLLVTTGPRVSEALGLNWSDVDLTAKTVRIERALVWHGSEYSIQPPKTRAGRRLVSLPEPALEALRKLPPPIDPEQPIFRTATGRPIRHEQTRDALDALCRKAGVPRINVHGLRHVAAMLALEATGDAYLVQRRLGHSHIGVTLAIYGYSARKEEVVAPSLNALLEWQPDETASDAVD
jgi:integrase